MAQREKFPLGGTVKTYCTRTSKGVWIFIKGHSYFIATVKKQNESVKNEAENSGGDILSPMPGKVFKVLVAKGDSVKRDQDLIVIEAMKMEHTLSAPCDGVVSDCKVSVGGLVDLGQVLLTITKAQEAQP